MAYALDFGLTSNGYVSVDCSTSDGSPNWEIEFKFKPVANPVSSFYRIAGEASPAGAQNRIIISTSGNEFRYYRSNLNYQINTSVDLSAEPVIMFKSNGSGVELYVDGVLKGSDGSGVVGVGLGNLGANFNTYFDGQLYYFKFTDFNTPANSRHFKKETLTGANDTVYNDLTNGQDGTQAGTWPSDNSEWIFFNDGGGSAVTSDVAFTVNVPTVSADTSATLPQPSADVNYSVSVPTVAASVAASLPQPLSDVSFTVNTPSVAANASATIPGYNASVSFTVSAPSVSVDASATLPSPAANISYAVSTPSVSADAAASLPQPDSGIAFTVNTPSVSATASATQTGWNADVSFSVNAPSVSISASATLPQPESAVSFAVSPPQVSVVAIVGGIAIIVDDETNINQRVLSNNINAPVLSNNING